MLKGNSGSEVAATEAVPIEFDQELFEEQFVRQVEAYLAKVVLFDEWCEANA
jgi:hypothetical protein